MKASGTMTLSVEGIISSLYAPIQLDNADVTFSVTPGEATGTAVEAKTGKVTAGSTPGTATVKATYGKYSDTIEITVTK